MARGTSTPKEDLGHPIPYDPDFNGPLKHRSCTDIICLFLFLIFVACWIGIGTYAYVNGNPDTLLIPRDSNGSRCGYDAHVIDKPNLLFFDLTKCLDPSVPFTGCDTPQVCVKKCPDKTFLFDAIQGPRFNPFGRTSNTDMRFEDVICLDDIKPKNYMEASELVNKNICTRWYLPSTTVLKRCLYNVADRKQLRPDAGKRSLDEVAVFKKNLQNSNTWLSMIIHSAIGFFTDKEYPHQVGNEVIEDIKNSWPEIVGGLAIGIAVCIIYIAMMRWIANIMIWLSIIGMLAILSFCVYLCATNYVYYKDHPYDRENAKTIFEEYVKTDTFWLVLLIIASVILGILLLVVIFLRSRIILAIGLIKEGSKAVSAATSSLFFPIVPWILQMLIIAYAIAAALYLSSIGKPYYEIRNFGPYDKCQGNASEYKNGVECSIEIFKLNCPSVNPDAKCAFIEMDKPSTIPYIHVFNVFGFFWAVFFVSALGEMILAATFATWYWTFKKSDVPFFTLTVATARTLRYHLGTLAFGSLIVAICRMIRVALEYIDHKLNKYNNPITKAILCCMKCFFWCLEKFLKFINKNAYIMCAIHGKNFCCSAKDAFGLLMRNIIRVCVLDKVTDFLFFLSKILVTLGVGCIVYSFIEFVSEKQLNYNIVPVIFVAICTYLVASVFFSVYTMAVDTLFLCFLEDCERNDGSENKPYYMSKNLMKILGKKNKKS